jgi:integrase
MYFDRPSERIELKELSDVRPRFREYLTQLKQPRLKRNSVRSYVNFLRILLERAKGVGWSEHPPEVEKSWSEIRAFLKEKKGCLGIADYAVHLGRTPADFSDADLDQWAEQQHQLGRMYEYVRDLKKCFRKAVSLAGLESRFPKVSFGFRQDYGVPVDQFPELIRTEVEAVIRWKTAPFVLGRRNRDRHRPITARNLQRVFSHLFGFAQKFLGVEPLTLADLVGQEVVGRYVEWCLNERRVCTRSLSVWLGMLAALGRCPVLAKTDLKWIRQLITELPPYSEEKTRDHKERKWKQYDDLDKVPGRILEDARRVTDPKRRASLVRDALLIKWLLTLPWRQRNIREARLGPIAGGGNIFKEESPPLLAMARPRSVEAAVRTDPNAKCWRVFFGSEETKTRHVVRCFVPSQLTPLLEDYVANHRPQLVGNVDPGTLFVNDHGRPFNAQSLEVRMGRITMGYAGRRVTPQLLRDVFAVAWLNDHPEDFVTLSRILWHRNINTTIRVYCRNFDESYATRHIEDWLDQKALRTRLATGQPDFADLFEEAVEKGVFSENVLLRTYDVLRRKLGFRR